MSPAESIAKLMEKRAWWVCVNRTIGTNGRLGWRTKIHERLNRIDRAIAVHEKRLLEAQEDIDPVFVEIVDRVFWDLLL